MVGFALETNDEILHAQDKLVRKNFDFIVLNSLNDKGAGFRCDTNKITIIERQGETPYPLKGKKEVAEDIIDKTCLYTSLSSPKGIHMLQSIYIQNYALIDKLDINFTSGFSVITGETGAGKSIILGAIGLLLGQRADVKAIKNGASKCIVEAHFHISNYGMESFLLKTISNMIQKNVFSAGRFQ